MSEYIAKNYSEQGGDKWVIGGTLEVLEGATIIGLEGVSSFTPAAAVEESSAESYAEINTTINQIITALKNAGLMANE